MKIPDPISIHPLPAIEAEITVPGDKSISHRAVMLSAISNGTCHIQNFLPSEDCLATANAFKKMGIHIENPEPSTLIVHGQGGNLLPPDSPIDCGNSGTTMRLLAGILAARPFSSTLIGDDSLSRRPMERIITPLSLMGASLKASGERNTPPLHIQGRSLPLQAIRYQLPIPSAQVKSAILLAALSAKGRTTVIEKIPSRDHTERMLRHFQVPINTFNGEISLTGGSKLESSDISIPGDISSAAFWIVAAAANPNSHLIVRNVGLNPTRTGFLRVLIRMGASIREYVQSSNSAEPSGTIEVHGSHLQATTISGPEIPNVIDEIPILSIAAALAEGTTTISDAAELRVKETDRLAAIANNLKIMDVDVQKTHDGLIITGSKKLKAAQIDSYGDHRIAMAFAIAGLFASGQTTIRNTACIATSYPSFFQTLSFLQKSNSQ
ncbi:MAG: 3-phosphoshikimate 1-carboxyvinyltransferase [Chthoniobacterales bacterium]|nr:3-phosphoshikimate 1-carboxyvinyltransferase [Chthoniobacterales bacterium]